MAKTPTPPDTDWREPLRQLLAAQQELALALATLTRQVAGLAERVAALPARGVVYVGTPPEIAPLMKQLPEALTWGPALPWQHLERRDHPWRKQLYVKGRNMTARQLVGAVKANNLTLRDAAADFDLPEEAVREALEYAEQDRLLLAKEDAYERHLLETRGHSLAPATVPG